MTRICRSHRWVQMEEHQSTDHTSRCPFHLRLPGAPVDHICRPVCFTCWSDNEIPRSFSHQLWRSDCLAGGFSGALDTCLFLKRHDISGQEASAKRAPLPVAHCSRPKSIGNGSCTYRCVGGQPALPTAVSLSGFMCMLRQDAEVESGYSSVAVLTRWAHCILFFC